MCGQWPPGGTCQDINRPSGSVRVWMVGENLGKVGWTWTKSDSVVDLDLKQIASTYYDNTLPPPPWQLCLVDRLRARGIDTEGGV